MAFVSILSFNNLRLKFISTLYSRCNGFSAVMAFFALLSNSTESPSRTVWHVNTATSREGEDSGRGTDTVTQSGIGNCTVPGDATTSGSGVTVQQRDEAAARATQSHNLMMTAATRVWEELYITKKPAIEEVCGV